MDGLEHTRQDLAAYLLGFEPSDVDPLCVMLFLHTHHVWLDKSYTTEEGISEWHTLTQRHSASTIAAIWPNQGDAERTDPYYWLYRFNSETPYEVVKDIPVTLRRRVEELKQKLIAHPSVVNVEEED